MKLIINKSQIETTPEQFLRQAGYAYIRDRQTGQDSFVRRLGSGFYPRLHMYISERDDKIIFNLHLDQKQASYVGQKRHSGEYEGEAVAAEIERLKGLIAHNAQRITKESETEENLLEKIGQGDLAEEKVEAKSRKWWKFW